MKMPQRMVDMLAPTTDDVEEERPLHEGKGRLVKARFPDEAAPNVQWFWLPIGNCTMCRYFGPPGVGGVSGMRCTNPDISWRQFAHVGGYLETNTCPEFESGLLYPDLAHGRQTDVERALGLIDGAPAQTVDILQVLPWSPEASRAAHAQQNAFLGFAQEADAARAAGREPSDDEYEIDDDLGPVTIDAPADGVAPAGVAPGSE